MCREGIGLNKEGIDMVNSAQVENSVLTFERIYERMRMANNLLKQFDMYALSTEPDLFATIQKMMITCKG